MRWQVERRRTRGSRQVSRRAGQKFDKDGDGQLNDAEKAEALKAFMADEPAAPTPTPSPGK